MRFIVYGAGAVGGVVAGRLHLSGADVQVVARGEHLATIRRRGLRLVSPAEDVTLEIPAADSLSGLDVGPDTAVLVAVKSHQTPGVLGDLAAYAPPDATVVSLQNGVANEQTLLRAAEHVLAVTVMLPATHLEPGAVEQASHPVPGMLDVGRYPGGTDERCEEFAAGVRAAGFESVVRPDVMAWKHRKLLTNLGNAAQASCAPSDDRERLVALAREEGERVLATAGIAVVTPEQDAERRGDLITPGAIGSRGGGSTWQSVRRGTGNVESDYLNGEISMLGRLHRVPTPANDLLRVTVARVVAARAEPGTLDAADLLARLA
jgi:2-dehydropantoate 2-reductase